MLSTAQPAAKSMRRRLTYNAAVTRQPEHGTMRELHMTILGLALGVAAVSTVQALVFITWRLLQIKKPFPS